MSSLNGKNEFDLDSILREFGALDEEPESSVPEFPPREVVKDSGDEDVFTAELSSDEPPLGFDIDRDAIIAEFNAESTSGAAQSAIDPDEIRREFAGETAPVHLPEAEVSVQAPEEAQIAAAKEAVRRINSAAETAAALGGETLSEVDRIVAEFRRELDARTPAMEPVIEPAPQPESEPVPEKTLVRPAAGHVIQEVEPEPVPEPTRERAETSAADAAQPDPELYENSGLLDDADESYATDSDFTPPEPAPKKSAARRKSRNFREAVAVPVISFMALIAMKIKQSQLTIGSTTYEDEELGDEMAPDKAASFYGRHIAGLRVRARIAFILCAVLIYLSYGLPVAGALADTGVKSAVCLILMLAVMICGLDLVTTGILSLVRLKFHASSLIAVSCLLCMIDAFLSACGVGGKLLPFCAVPSLTIAFALLGCILNARSSRIVFNTAAGARDPYTLTADASPSGGDITLVKARRCIDGIVRRTEEEGPDESVFGTLTPYFIVVALILAVVSAAVTKSFPRFAHTLSGIFACAAPIAMLISFPLPFFVSVKTLIRSGCTIAGWSGLYDIGRSKHLIITDSDLFPRGCVKIGKVHILSGMKSEKVVSFAGSIVCASGSSMAEPFAELMRKANAVLLPVDGFTVHESGGLTAMVDGEEVLCGNAAFMRLMGVVLPEKYVIRSGVYVAVSGRICGVFEVEYTATDAVREALGELMRSQRHAIFAVRDFNVTPQMLSVKFDMPTDGFDFPPYPERYSISGAEPSDGSRPAALILREGLGSLVSLADHGKALYGRIRLGVMLSVMSAVIGMAVVFIISLSSVPAVSSVLTYLLAWLAVSIILAFVS